MKKVKGSVSIYLCIILLSMIMLISVLAERARISTVQAKCKAVTYMATESVLAGYGKQIYENYGLLLAWENVSVEESLKKYMQANINKTDLKGTGTNFMDSSTVDIAECNVKYVTEDGGKGFLEQVKKYIQYAGMLETADKLIDLFSNHTANKEIEKKEESITFIADKTSDELLSIVEKINKKLEKLKKVENLEKKKAAFKGNMETKKIVKIYDEIIVILEEKEDVISEAITLIKNYIEEKELFLSQNGYSDSISDYMEDNLIILEELRDEILKVKELKVSQNIKDNLQQRICLYLDNIMLKINNLRTNNASDEDKKKASVFDSAKKMINKGVVALVTENTKHISQNAISTTNLPSRLKEEISENLYDKAKLLVYGNNKFGNFLDSKKNTALKYEMEYLIGGKSSDSDNLAETIKRIIAIRNVVNLSVLLTDSEKINEISAIAASVAVVTGLPFMEMVAKAVLIEALALAESIYEVKLLLKKGTIPIVKTKEYWNVDLDNLLLEPQKKTEEKGMNYVSYCNVILMQLPISKIAYRMMDLIQENIQLRYNSDFSMEKCFTSIKIKTNFQLTPLFMAMPWTLNMSQEDDAYNFQITNENSY